MASGKPIVASDLPSIREVLDEADSYFVKPDDPHALAQGIVTALTDSSASAKAAGAREKVAQFTWNARAQIIMQSWHERRIVPQ
jgi:glycosyltransferase involved in cell wall biosynthesis